MRQEQMELEITLTEEGFARLAAELERLTTVGRREVAERLRLAYESGDGGEAGEVAEVRREQERLEFRIRRLEDQLARARVVRQPGRDGGVVRIGSRVWILRLASGRAGDYRLVGAPESDPRRGLLSAGSPLGRALLGRRAGETVVAEGPAGEERVRIERVGGPPESAAA